MALTAIALLFNMVLPTRAATCSENWTASFSPLFASLTGCDMPNRAPCTPHHHSPQSCCIQGAQSSGKYRQNRATKMDILYFNDFTSYMDEPISQHPLRLFKPGIQHKSLPFKDAIMLLHASIVTLYSSHFVRIFDTGAMMPPPATPATPSPPIRGQVSNAKVRLGAYISDVCTQSQHTHTHYTTGTNHYNRDYYQPTPQLDCRDHRCYPLQAPDMALLLLVQDGEAWNNLELVDRLASPLSLLEVEALPNAPVVWSLEGTSHPCHPQGVESNGVHQVEVPCTSPEDRSVANCNHCTAHCVDVLMTRPTNDNSTPRAAKFSTQRVSHALWCRVAVETASNTSSSSLDRVGQGRTGSDRVRTG